MKKLFSFLLIVVLIACSKDPVIYTLTATANPAEGGSVSPSSQQYDSGDVATVTATPSAEYVFQSWSGSASGSSPSTTVTMDSDKAVVANFVKKKYALTINVEGEGSVTEKVIKAGIATDYTSGTVVELTAVPEGEWLFVEWTGDLTGSENPKEITIDKAKTVTAVFVKKQYPLTIEIEGEGTVSEKVIKQGLATDYNSGTIVELTAEPTGDWEFVEWSGDITSTENPAQITIDGPKTVKVKFIRPIYFEFNHPNYSILNLKSGTVVNNIYSHNKILLPEEIASRIEIYEECDCQGCGCKTKFLLSENTYRLFDFNNDNKPDLFGFLVNASMDASFSTQGKYVLVDDVFGSFKIKYIESERWFAGLSELGDFDNDGLLELLLFSSEDHDNNNGQPVSSKIPLSIIDISLQGDISIREIGYNTSNHDLTTLDFDNDGDIDIVNFEWYMYEDIEHKEIPLVYLNDGSGNFEIKEDLIKLPETYYNNPGDFIRTATDSFDLDNDGHLDIISGYIFPSNLEYNQGAEVIWGNSNEYDYSKSSKLNIDISNANVNSKEYLGFNFIDYNNDSYYDIIAFGDTNGYQGGFIDVYHNNGDRTFELITENVIDNNLWNARRNGGIIPIMYEISIIDVDNDGDFDIKPNNFVRGDYVSDAVSSNKKSIGENFYWENNNGIFNLKEDYYTIDSKWFQIVYKKDY